jgi:hypothetical protein
MDENTAYALSTVTQGNSHEELIQKIYDNWFKQYGFLREIHLKKGKVEVSQLTQTQQQYNVRVRLPLTTRKLNTSGS